MGVDTRAERRRWIGEGQELDRREMEGKRSLGFVPIFES